MSKEYITQLYHYNVWANHRLLDTAARLTDEQVNLASPLGSVRAILIHNFGAEAIWRSRCQDGVSPSGFFDEANYPTLADLKAAWSAEEARMQSYLAGLTDEALTEMIHYNNLAGESFQTKLSDILIHVVFHGMQHRSELAALCTSYGASPGSMDFITFVRQSVS